MVDAKTGAVVRNFAIGNHADCVVDAWSGHAFLLSHAPIKVTMLNTRTGTVLSRAEYGTGNWVIPWMASRTGQLIAVTETGRVILDTRTGRHLRTLKLSTSNLNSAINDRLSRFVIASRKGQVHIYDMHTWTMVKTLQLPGSVPESWTFSAAQPSVANAAISVVGLILAAIGLPLLWLASMEEANLWREAGVWVSVLAYMGALVGVQIVMVGTGVTGAVLHFGGVALGVIALLFTLIAFSKADRGSG